MNLTDNDILSIFKKTDALLDGHFLLTSGRHSNRYFQCAKVLQFPEYTTSICEKLYLFFQEFNIDTIIAPALGGIIVGQEVARQLNKRFIFAERENKELILRRGFTISEGENVLICEDVVTTGGSVFEVMNIVKSSGGNVIGVGTIVDRSNGKVDFGVHHITGLKLEVVSYAPDECNLCKENIPLVKPGSRKI